MCLVASPFSFQTERGLLLWKEEFLEIVEGLESKWSSSHEEISGHKTSFKRWCDIMSSVESVHGTKKGYFRLNDFVVRDIYLFGWEKMWDGDVLFFCGLYIQSQPPDLWKKIHKKMSPFSPRLDSPFRPVTRDRKMKIWRKWKVNEPEDTRWNNFLIPLLSLFLFLMFHFFSSSLRSFGVFHFRSYFCCRMYFWCTESRIKGIRGE